MGELQSLRLVDVTWGSPGVSGACNSASGIHLGRSRGARIRKIGNHLNCLKLP